jgi:hypothetical protein
MVATEETAKTDSVDSLVQHAQSMAERKQGIQLLLFFHDP